MKKLKFQTIVEWSEEAPGRVDILLDGKSIGVIFVALFDSEIYASIKTKRWFKPQIIHSGYSMERNLINAKKHIRQTLKDIHKL